MAEELENWACAKLDSLGLPDASVIIQYLQPLENPVVVEDYLNSMLDISQPHHREFIKEFLRRQADSKVDKRFYRKGDLAEDSTLTQGKKKGKNNSNLVSNHTNVGSKDKDKNSNKKGPANGKENKVNTDNSSRVSTPVGSAPLQPTQNQGKKKGKDSDQRQVSPPAGAATGATAQTPPSQGKKKTKFVNLYSNDGTSDDVIFLSGRHSCECLASKHKLINNCLSCGRIVCEQEGSGPCFFCGNMVQTKDEREGNVIPVKTVTEKSSSKSRQISVKDIAADIQRAVDHKNKLLEYDKTSEKRTKVLDDQSDYFDSNSKWVSKSDQEKLQAREAELKIKQYDRSTKNVTIDLLGRKIIVDEKNDACIYDPDDPIVKAILQKQPDDIFATYERTNQLAPESLQRPVYIDTNNTNGGETQDVGKFGKVKQNNMSRLQDGLLQEMSDQGKCLSMHQPYATLLINGIKVHEGRTWYSAHRGRLWIASAAKQPDKEEISTVEEFYRLRENGDNLVLPQHYPAGCLLGCVDVIDVLPQEEYRVQYPDGESESPYVFVCNNSQEMIFKFPMKGEHKIYQLDPKIHQAAKKALK
uniref:Activating signal cointegrator 1-like n=1 Tax=Hirondellea gigas TaxID=1518452 RepID=A0A2P2I2W1_9CRUS